MSRRRLALVLGIALTHAAQAADVALCASNAEAERVRPLYAAPPVPPPFMTAPKLGLSDAQVLSALPATAAVGTSATAFASVWRSLQGWDRALKLVLKGGHIFEINGRIPAGEASTISQNFNLKGTGTGLAGHLRPDLLAGIYAISLAGREGPMRGVMFLDQAGATAFSVFLPEGEQPTTAEIAQFDSTRALIASLPPLCPAI